MAELAEVIEHKISPYKDVSEEDTLKRIAELVVRRWCHEKSNCDVDHDCYARRAGGLLSACLVRPPEPSPDLAFAFLGLNAATQKRQQ